MPRGKIRRLTKRTRHLHPAIALLLPGAVRVRQPGDVLEIVVQRDGNAVTVTATLGRRGGGE